MHYILRSRAKARVVRCNLRAKNFTSALQRRLWTPSFSQKFKKSFWKKLRRSEGPAKPPGEGDVREEEGAVSGCQEAGGRARSSKKERGGSWGNQKAGGSCSKKEAGGGSRRKKEAGGGSHGKKEAGSAVLLSTFFSTMQPLHTPRRKKQRRERSRKRRLQGKSRMGKAKARKTGRTISERRSKGLQHVTRRAIV
eukprot:g33668.t1